MFFDGNPDIIESKRIEREVLVERADLLQPENILRALPNLHRADRGPRPLEDNCMVFQGMLSYQSTATSLSATIKITQQRKAWISVGYEGSLEGQATACCNELAKLFKTGTTSS